MSLFEKYLETVTGPPAGWRYNTKVKILDSGQTGILMDWNPHKEIWVIKTDDGDYKHVKHEGIARI